METLNNWAIRWNIPPAALQDLKRVMNVAGDVIGDTSAENETAVGNLIRVAASRHGSRLWRNNCGAAYDATGRLVRYGLLNESPKVAKEIKSSDLIGITPYVVQPQDVGKTFGIFTAFEVKIPGWRYTDKAREKAQFAFLKLVAAMGGIARFVTSPKDAGYD